MNREETLQRVRARKEPWDIVIIGGGATGAGCALDAASRGLAVLLLEQHDFGKGTSSRSTKLIHGGVRYLRQGNISLVREALRERSLLLLNAPHVVHQQEFIIPCYSVWEKLFYALGMRVYDLLAGKHSIGSSRMLGAAETYKRLPAIRSEGLAGGVSYFDGQFDDTRLLIDILSTAVHHGAAVLNYARVGSLSSGEGGKVNGLLFEDVETGETFAVPARVIINAAGIFSDEVRQMSGQYDAALTFAQGTHVVLDRRFMPGDDAIMIPKTSDGRVLFCIPWQGYVLVGTTDIPVDGPSIEPRALDAETDFILETAAGYLRKRPSRSDVLSVFSGIRPLLRRKGAKRTASLSRGHELFTDDSGLVTITGGKWTTYRQMAEEAVDRGCTIGGLSAGPCITATLAIRSARSETGGSRPVHPAFTFTESDVSRAVRDEMARTVEDVLARRTRVLFLDAAAAAEAASIVAAIVAKGRGLDEAWAIRQTLEFTALARQYLSPTEEGRRSGVDSDSPL